MIGCVHCGRQMHSICVLHFDNIWSKGYQCESCLKALNITRKENKFSAKRKWSILCHRAVCPFSLSPPLLLTLTLLPFPSPLAAPLSISHLL